MKRIAKEPMDTVVILSMLSTKVNILQELLCLSPHQQLARDSKQVQELLERVAIGQLPQLFHLHSARRWLKGEAGPPLLLKMHRLRREHHQHSLHCQ